MCSFLLRINIIGIVLVSLSFYSFFTPSLSLVYFFVRPYRIRTVFFLHFKPKISHPLNSLVLRMCVPPQGHDKPATDTILTIVLGCEVGSTCVVNGC
jgi:hypothetical protein